MDAMDTSQLRELAACRTGPCVSIYLPTHVTGEESKQDLPRLKSMLQRAEGILVEGWLRSPEAGRLLQAARGLLTDVSFWEGRSLGLGIFAAPEVFRAYRVPRSFEELVFVNRRFHIKPLLPLVSGRDRFFILALSQNHVRLFAASRHTIEQIAVDGLPTNMKEALDYTQADRGSQVHSADRAGRGKQAGVFHGQGGQPDAHKEDLAQFFRLVDRAIQPVLRDTRSPLVLGGVEYLLPIYRQVSGYAQIAEPELLGNCDRLTPHELHRRAWPLIEPIVLQAREEAKQRYGQLADTPQASDNVPQVLKSANEGRIDTLFVDVGAHQWGRFDPETGCVEVHDRFEPNDDDLLDLAVVETLLHRGTVYAVELDQMPHRKPLAALFRY
jgi:hypothetical protein